MGATAYFCSMNTAARTGEVLLRRLNAVRLLSSAYAVCGARKHWIVSPDGQCIELHLRFGNDTFCFPGHETPCGADPRSRVSEGFATPVEATFDDKACTQALEK